MPLNLNLSYLPQYLFAYVLGYQSFITGRSRLYGPFDADPRAKSKANDDQPRSEKAGLSLPAAVLVSFATLPSIALPTILRSGFSGFVPHVLAQVSGGWNPSALIYAVWNEFSSPSSARHSWPTSGSMATGR